MAENIFYFLISFLSDFLAYLFYQQYVDSRKKDIAALLWAILSAILVWVFVFKLQDRGQVLRVFIPAWSAGTAVFGYFAAGYASKTPLRDLVNPAAIVCIVAIGLGIYFLERLA